MAEKPTYIMIPRKTMGLFAGSYILLFVLCLASFQYTNWVDRRSNQLLCGLVSVSDDSYKKAPPTSETGKLLAIGFDKARRGFKCE